jgi:hypothetical protein
MCKSYLLKYRSDSWCWLQNSELQCFQWLQSYAFNCRHAIQMLPFSSSIEAQFDGRGSASITTGSPSCQQEIKPPTLHVMYLTTLLSHTYWTENATLPHNSNSKKKNNYKQYSS